LILIQIFIALSVGQKNNTFKKFLNIELAVFIENINCCIALKLWNNCNVRKKYFL